MEPTKDRKSTRSRTTCVTVVFQICIYMYAAALVLSLVVAGMYIERAYAQVRGIDLEAVMQCIQADIERHMTDPIRAPHNDRAGSVELLEQAAITTYPAPTYELTTYDPYIERILNGSKSAVFMIHSGNDDAPHTCDQLEHHVDAIVTLRAYRNYTAPHEPIARIISGVRIKKVVHINILSDLIGTVESNCGTCDREHFCEVAKQHAIYRYFEPNVAPSEIVERVFSSYAPYLQYTPWYPYNHRTSSARTCGGYSVSDFNGYYFMLESLFEPPVQTIPTVTSRINHKPIRVRTFAKIPRTHQCFIEVELVGAQ